jgi:fibronectin type 3 domain-containing protein
VAGATKYRLYAAKTSYGSGLDVGNYFKEVTSTSYNDTYPEAGETWYYKVSAVNSAGEGPQSSVVSAKITSSTGGDSPTINTPNTPYGSPVIKNKTSNGWTVEWNASLNATGYKLYRKSNLSSNWGLAYSGSSTSFTDTGLTSGVTYYYRVTATNTAGESDYSGEKSIMF